MTKEKLDDLIKRAEQFIGKTIPVKKGFDIPENENQFIDHIFTNIGNIASIKEENDKSTFYVNGLLKAPDDTINSDVSLYDIVKHFESQ